MDDATADKLRRRARLKAELCGFMEQAEDLAQDVVVHYLEGRGNKQTVNQALIDVIRSRFGRPNYPGYRAKQRLERAGSIEQARHVPAPASQGLDDIVGGLSGMDRAILILSFQWGLTHDEIAHAFGVSSGLISQRMAKRIRELRDSA